MSILSKKIYIDSYLMWKSDLSVEITSVSSVCIMVRGGVHAHGIQRVRAGQHTHAHEQVGN